MATGIQVFSTPEQRVGIVKGQILAHAMPKECLSKIGEHYEMPTNQGDTIKMRQYLPYGATVTNPNQFFAHGTGDRGNAMAQAHMTQEGVTPPPDSLDKRDVTVVLNQFDILYGHTDKTALLYEDDIPKHQKKQVGERMTLVREMVRYGATRASTNQFYGGSGSSRGTVAGPITLGLLRSMKRSLRADHAEPVNSILQSSVKFGTVSVDEAYNVYGHTSLEADLSNLPGWKWVRDYGDISKALPGEVGSCEGFRFILRPEFVPYEDAGAAIGSTGCVSTTGTLIDVYPLIVTGENSWGDVSLRGNSFDYTNIAVGTKSSADPFGQRGYVGAIWWDAAVVTNNGWIAICNVGISTLSA